MTVEVVTVVCHSTPVRIDVVSVDLVVCFVVVGGMYVVGVMIDSEEEDDHGGNEEEEDQGYGGREEEDGAALELETPVPYGYGGFQPRGSICGSAETAPRTTRKEIVECMLSCLMLLKYREVGKMCMIGDKMFFR